MPVTPDGYNVQRVRVSATADGDNTVVAAPGTDKSILILGYNLRSIGAGISILRSGAAGSQIDSVTGVAAPGTPMRAQGDSNVGVALVDANTALVINNAAGVDVTGYLAYRIV
jgi:hypothetical protein